MWQETCVISRRSPLSSHYFSNLSSFVEEKGFFNSCAQVIEENRGSIRNTVENNIIDSASCEVALFQYMTVKTTQLHPTLSQKQHFPTCQNTLA